MSKYRLEELKEGRILVFEEDKCGSGKYGIITYDNGNQDINKKELTCLYSKGGWDSLKNILKKNFKLYESESPLYSFINLIKDEDLGFYIDYKKLKEITVKTEEALEIERIENEILELTNKLFKLKG